MREVVYIAGPYGATTNAKESAEAEIRRNVARSLALGRLAAMRGLAPIVPHAIGFLGTYGTQDESGDGVRDRAVESGEAHAAMVGRCDGRLWMIRKDDGSLSSGCSRELEAWGTAGLAVTSRTWVEWRDAFVVAGLEAVWADPVAAFGLEL